MNLRHLTILLFSGLLVSNTSLAQSKMYANKSDKGTISIGVRSTLSAFDSDGTGLGTGGQFRIQLGDRVNTDWFADYISINSDDVVQSIYYHVGWSVLFYPIKNKAFLNRFQPYLAAGHCFDYNRKTLIENRDVSKGRWGSAAQAGVGTHFHITSRVDLTLSSLYMVHLTKELELEQHHDGEYEFHEHSHNVLQGHLLTTLSVNFKLNRK